MPCTRVPQAPQLLTLVPVLVSQPLRGVAVAVGEAGVAGAERAGAGRRRWRVAFGERTPCRSRRSWSRSLSVRLAAVGRVAVAVGEAGGAGRRAGAGRCTRSVPLALVQAMPQPPQLLVGGELASRSRWPRCRRSRRSPALHAPSVQAPAAARRGSRSRR